MSTITRTRQVGYSRLLWVSFLTAVLVDVLNAVVFLIGSSQGAFPETVTIPPMGMPMSQMSEKSSVSMMTIGKIGGNFGNKNGS